MDANDRRERIANEAAEWWVTLQGEASREEREQYVDWLRESGLHVAEMLRVAQVHGALKQFERWSKIETGGSGDDEGTVVPLASSQLPPTPTPSTPNRAPRRVTLVRALAAVLILAAIGLAATLLIVRNGQVIETQRGERREVALTDGSVLQVDPETHLRVAFDEHTRRVSLERGRALFHVAKNPARPFLVQADGTTVRAVGTAFGVERNERSVVVTVAEGRVAVLPTALVSEPPEASPAIVPKAVGRTATRQPATTERHAAVTGESGSAEVSNVGNEVFLDAGQQLTVEGSGAAEPVREIDSNRALAWADGRLIFENESVEHVVEQFNRYNRVQLQVRDAELAKRPISGTFGAADPESFVQFLQTVSAVKVSHDDAGNTVIEGAKSR